MDGKESSLDDKHNHNDASSLCSPRHLLAGVTVGSLPAPVIGTRKQHPSPRSSWLRFWGAVPSPQYQAFFLCIFIFVLRATVHFTHCQSDMLKNAALRLDLLSSPSSLSVKSFFFTVTIFCHIIFTSPHLCVGLWSNSELLVSQRFKRRQDGRETSPTLT